MMRRGAANDRTTSRKGWSLARGTQLLTFSLALSLSRISVHFNSSLTGLYNTT